MANKAEAKTVEEKKPQFALMFELEYLAADARVATFQTLKGILKEREIAFTQAQFSRLCLSSTPAFFMEAVQEAVGARKLSTRKLVEDVGNGVAMHLADGKLSLSAFPWARVIVVKNNATGAVFPIPADLATPAVLELPPGAYLIDLVSGVGTERRQISVNVLTGQVAEHNETFASPQDLAAQLQ